MSRELPHWKWTEILEVKLKSGVSGYGETLLYYTWGVSDQEDIQRCIGKNAAELMWDDSLGAGLQMALFDAVARQLEMHPFIACWGAKYTRKHRFHGGTSIPLPRTWLRNASPPINRAISLTRPRGDRGLISINKSMDRQKPSLSPSRSTWTLIPRCWMPIEVCPSSRIWSSIPKSISTSLPFLNRTWKAIDESERSHPREHCPALWHPQTQNGGGRRGLAMASWLEEEQARSCARLPFVRKWTCLSGSNWSARVLPRPIRFTLEVSAIRPFGRQSTVTNYSHDLLKQPIKVNQGQAKSTPIHPGLATIWTGT